MRRYGGGILYAALPLHMQRGCFQIRTHDQQVTKAQLYRCTRGSVADYLSEFETLANCIMGLPPPFLLSCFILGLAPKVRQEVQVLQPLSLVNCYS